MRQSTRIGRNRRCDSQLVSALPTSAYLTPVDADTCFGGDHCTVNASGTVAVTGETTPSANTSPGGESVSQFGPANA